MSGIATATSRMVGQCSGTNAKILETRKTAPGLRMLDKWAVLIGGGCNHRMGLFDMIMIKDNHIAAAGGLRQAVEQACAFVRSSDREIAIEVETRTLEEVRSSPDRSLRYSTPTAGRVQRGSDPAAGGRCLEHCLLLRDSAGSQKLLPRVIGCNIT